MATTAQLTKEHAKAAERAGEYFAMLAKAGELPFTPDDFAARVKAFYAELDKRQEAANALVLAALQDQPCPCALFKPWASWDAIRNWSRKETDPLPTELLNGKLCIKPSDFFRAFKLHGKAP